MNALTVLDDDPDDPIVWQCGRLLESGEARVFFMRRSDETRLLKAFGREWLDCYIAEKELEIGKVGIH